MLLHCCLILFQIKLKFHNTLVLTAYEQTVVKLIKNLKNEIDELVVSKNEINELVKQAKLKGLS